MSASIKYTSQPSLLEQQQILSLLSDAFTNQTISKNTLNGFFSGYRCEYENFVLLLKENTVIGVAIVAKRKINLLNSLVDALSIGPIAIAPSYQQQGYSGQLMGAVNDLADKFGVTVLYLQGIDGFYNKYSFFTCSSKSKLVFKINEIKEMGGVTVNPMSALNIEDVASIYTSNAHECSCTSFRCKEDWDWLLKYGCQTWYFYEPTLVLSNGKPIGYFCTDPEDAGRMREAVCEQSEGSFQAFLAGLTIYSKQKSIEKFEVMTWIGSPLYNFTKKYCNAEFVQFFKDNGSQMMKIHNYSRILELLAGFSSSNFVVKNIENIEGYMVFQIKFDEKLVPIKVAEKFLPGLICGFFDSRIIQNLDDLPQEAKENFENFINSLNSPFFYQGDNY